MSCWILSSQGNTNITDNSTERFIHMPLLFFHLPVAISPTIYPWSWTITVINWKSELVCSMKQLPGATTLQLSERNHQPSSRRSESCSSSCQHAPLLQKARPGQISAGSQAAYCRLFLGDGFSCSSQWSQHDRYHNLFFLSFMVACKHFWPSQLESSMQGRRMPVLPPADFNEDAYHISLFTPLQFLTQFWAPLSTSAPGLHRPACFANFLKLLWTQIF